MILFLNHIKRIASITLLLLFANSCKFAQKAAISTLEKRSSKVIEKFGVIDSKSDTCIRKGYRKFSYSQGYLESYSSYYFHKRYILFF